MTTSAARSVAVGIATMAMTLFASTSLAAPADAKPKKQPGTQQYLGCVFAGFDGISKNWSQIPDDAREYVLENCCLNLGGIYNESAHECYLPNGETAKPPTQPPPSPGSVALPRDPDSFRKA